LHLMQWVASLAFSNPQLLHLIGEIFREIP